MKEKKYYVFEMDTDVLNIISAIILIFMFILAYFIFKIDVFDGVNYIAVLIIYVFWMILHEILHSVSYLIHGANFRYITFGVNLEKGVLCCLCKQNINKRNILTSLLYPFMFIGVLTYVIAVIFNLKILLLLSICNLAGCSGDLIMFYSLSRLKNFEFSEFDNPIGFGLYSSTDLSKKKLFGLKYIETKDELKKENLKKITVTKSSITIILIFILILILGFVL